MKRFVAFLLTALVVFVPIVLLITVRSGGLGSKVGALDWRERIHVVRGVTAEAA